MTEQHLKVIEQLAIAALQSGVIRDFESAVAVNEAINATRSFYLHLQSLNLPVTGKPVIYNGNKESGKESANSEESGKENRQKI